MRRYWVVVLAALALLAMLSPPAFAQAPTPKVTIHGLLDSVVAWEQNLNMDANTTTREELWWSRHRGRFDITGQVGKAKAVYGFELDFVDGKNPAGVTNQATGNPAGGVTGIGSCGLDLGIDEAPVGVSGTTGTRTGVTKTCIEVTTLYVDFPGTGPGSLVPQIPVPTQVRWGGQTYSGHEYKTGILAQDRFGGVDLKTALAPNVRNTFTYVQIEEAFTKNTGVSSPPFQFATESFAILESLEVTPQKGLTVKPTLLYWFTQASGGNTTRVTIGADARWRQGPYTFEPTFLYQFGEAESQSAPGGERDISSFIVDVIGGWRSGPLKVGLRFAYSPGNDSTDTVARDSDIDNYTPLPQPATYWNGWTHLMPGYPEYQTQITGNTSATPAATIGFVGPNSVNAGLIAFTLKADYALTPALSVGGLIHPRWAAEDVDTNNDNSGASGTDRGDENFLGTELAVKLVWKFAPNLSFDAGYGYWIAGDAFDRPGPNVGESLEGNDSQSLAGRVRFTF